jgi:hypothetical protein
MSSSGIVSILFRNSEPGVFYDPSDLTTLFTDTAGTTPVTTPGQTVALLLDKSKGGQQSLPVTGWTVNSGDGVVTITDNVITITGATTTTRVDLNSPGWQIGDYARVTVNASIGSAVSPAIYVGAGSPFNISAGVATYSAVISSTTLARVQVSSGSATFTITARSRTPGNHATQGTTASRPTYGIVPLGGRRNLMIQTEAFETASWTKSSSTITENAGVSPDGTTTAELLYPSSSGNNRWVYQTYTGASAIYTRSVYAKASGKNFLCIDPNGGGTLSAYFNLSTGAVGTVSAGYTATITSVGSGWYRCSVRNSANETSSFGGVYAVVDADNSRAVTASGTDGILLWGAQLETGSPATAYQRVTTQYDVTESGVQSLSYLSFDGVDDFLVTPTITPGIDKVQVFAGVRKLSDAAAGIIAELSINSNTNTGSFAMVAPAAATPSYFWRSYGNGAVGDVTATTYTAPISNVLTGQGAIATDSSTLRINGTQVGSSSVDLGTGNFLAYPLYIGRRGGTSSPFNGQIYSILVRFGANLTATQITNTERYVNKKTGAY